MSKSKSKKVMRGEIGNELGALSASELSVVSSVVGVLGNKRPERLPWQALLERLTSPDFRLGECRLLKPERRFSIPAIPARQNKECFVGKGYQFDHPKKLWNLVPSGQPSTPRTDFWACGFHVRTTIAHIVDNLTGLVGDDPAVSEALVALGHTMTLSQIEHCFDCMWERTETGLSWGDFANLFFVEGIDDRVFVARASFWKSQGKYSIVSVHDLTDPSLWLRGSRVCVRAKDV